MPGTVYRVVRHLATGGMGSVYDVEDMTVGKRYVLKTLHPQLVARQDLARRMEAEARALARLQHPNIVDVVTAGVTSDDRRMPFYVMERLNGHNLRVVLEKKGALELRHCYRIAIDVLDALEHAHENSIIHRDVKPENIFLHRNVNGTTITKLLDFGIMRLLDRQVSYTQGQFIGTLRYASPEQVFGGDLGPQSDIYSLGVVLYEMIAGRGPFDDIGDAYAVGAAHAQSPAPPLSRFTDVPGPLERLVMSSLAKAPHDRPRDCFAFASELRRMLQEEEADPKSATQVNVLSVAPPTKSAPPKPLPAAGVGFAATAIGLAPILERTETVDPAHAPGPTEFGNAATLASEGGAAGVVERDVRAVAPGIDRAAETRARPMAGATLPLARNGTAIDSPLFGVDGNGSGADMPVVDAAANKKESFRDPLGTGPMAGEAPTRPPPHRAMILPMLGAAIFGALVLAGGTALYMRKPWQNKGLGAPTGSVESPVPGVPSAELLPPKPERSTASASAAPAETATPEPAPDSTRPAVMKPRVTPPLAVASTGGPVAGTPKPRPIPRAPSPTPPRGDGEPFVPF